MGQAGAKAAPEAAFGGNQDLCQSRVAQREPRETRA